MNRIFAVGFLVAAYAMAQPTIAPTEEQVGSPRAGPRWATMSRTPSRWAIAGVTLMATSASTGAT